MAKALLNGINVHYQVKGEGPDVVLIHGVTSSLAVWFARVMPELSRKYRVTAYDLRGHGYSDPTPTGYTSRAMTDDLLALMDHLGIQRARLVGHSFGGSIALHTALLHPERVDGVVLADTGVACLRYLRTIQDWPGWEIYKDRIAKYGITYAWFVEAEAGDVRDVIRKSYDMIQPYGSRKGAKVGTPRLRRLIEETNIAAEFREVAGMTEDLLAKIAAPVLAVYGENSPYQKMAARLTEVVPNCGCELIPGAGHFYLLEQMDLFLDLIAGFLDDPAGHVASGRTSNEGASRVVSSQAAPPADKDNNGDGRHSSIHASHSSQAASARSGATPRSGPPGCKTGERKVMPRILLVSPRRGADFAERKVRRASGQDVHFPRAMMPPLDLATIKGLTPPDFAVDIWDESVQEPITEATPFEHQYDLVGVTAYNLHIPWALNLAQTVRRRGIPIVIGGPGVSAAPEQCRGIFDTVFIGEAEFTWPQFLRDFQDGSPRREYRQVERPDVGRSPMPDWTGFHAMSQDYLLGAVQATRGCPFDCEFCDVIHLFGRQPRHKTIDTIVREVVELQKLGMRIIFFCDDNFIGRPQYAKDLLRELIALNKTFERPLGFTTQLTMNVVKDDELLELLADANFSWVLIGIESPREASLRETNKPQNYQLDMIEAIRKIQSYGVLVKGSMIVGFDHDDTDIFDEIHSFLRESRVLDSGLSMLHAYPGTPLLSRLQRDGRVVELSDKELWRNTRPSTNIIPKQMTRVELFQGYKGLVSRIRSWEYFGACAKEIVENIRRKPQVPPGPPPDPARAEQARRAIESLEEGPRQVVKDVLQHTFLHAPFMLEKIVSALFRFGGLVEWLPNMLKEMDAQIERESAPDFTLTKISTIPKIPVGFRETIQKDPFPKSVDQLRAGLTEERFLAAALVRVWRDFLIRWSESFEKFEDFHYEYLRELCDRTIEVANRGELADAVVNGALGKLGRVEMRRLAGEVLVSVEQDLRGQPHGELVPLGMN